MFGEIEKTYDPAAIEPRWAEIWASSGWFHASAESDKPAWSLVIPPPNVTGSLHFGHMLEHTLIDATARWRRMCGDNALWLPGTDHAGIATQVVVERELRSEGLTREALGREKFEARVWEWKEKSGNRIHEQMVRLGASCDWARERFTLDPGLSRAVREVFVALYEEGLIYRGRYLVNWCPRCRTALSDLEVAREETVGKLYRVRYPFATGDGAGGEARRDGLVVATTRPETMPGDVAVAVNPRDERYSAALGRRLRLPLTEREIPVIADELAQPEFGTGAVKVTPAHDANDFAAGERHHLPMLEVIGEDGRMTAAAGVYAGLDRFAAREKIIADLEREGLLLGADDHPMALGRCQRCRTVVEPRLSTQWFVKIAPLAEAATAAVERDFIRFTPENYRRIYLDWMANLHDWCVSRQLWWGHRIPAWYCRNPQCPRNGPAETRPPAQPGAQAGAQAGTQADARPIVARDEPAACPDCGGALVRDPDVLDTWFSSALWPFSTLGWPEATADLKTFYPTSLLITGYDILFFWVARMVMMGVHFRMRDGAPMAEAVPFRHVYIHGLVRDAEKQKMSKTKGNVIDPIAVTARYGTDAVRFTLAAMTGAGSDIALAEARMEGYRAFANKIWNAARFLFLSLDRAEAAGAWRPRGPAAAANLKPAGEDLTDRWIFSRLSATAERVAQSLAGFRYHDAADALYHFFWHEFCDWYLELVKPRLSGADAANAAENLFNAFDAALRLLHPFMPFLTEQLWQTLCAGAPPRPTLALADFPRPAARDEAAERQMELAQDVVTRARRLRAERQAPAKARLDLRFAGRDARVEADFSAARGVIELLAAVKAELGPAAEGAGRITAPEYDAALDFTGAVDPAAERARLEKQREEAKARWAATAARLADARFSERAPAAVRAEQERKRDEYAAQLERLDAALSALK